MTGVEDLLRLYIVHQHFGVLAFVMWHGQIVAIEFRNENATGIGKSAAYISWNPPKSLWSVKSCTLGIQFQLERVSVSKGPRNDGI
jgi:hypothetical protein